MTTDAQRFASRYFFPGTASCYLAHTTILQWAVKETECKGEVLKDVVCHPFGHSCATHLIEGGYDIRNVQEFSGHNDVKTPMIYTRILNRGPASELSPVDGL